METIKDNKLFDKIVNNCIVNLCQSIIEEHQINPYFNFYCFDIILRYSMSYLIELINKCKPQLNNCLLSTFIEYIETFDKNIDKDDINYIKNWVNNIIDTIIITLKVNHDDSNDIITHYVKYATCDDVLFVCEEILNRLD